MNEIITVNTDTQTVSARKLHKAMEVTDRFSRWFARMTEYGFIENEDYTGVKSSTLVNNGAELELQDYEMSIDMAKHICMVQRTDKAKEVRQYLIDLEKAWNTPEQVMARALKLADQTIASLTVQVKEMKPKADYFDYLVDKKLNTGVRDTAKEFGIKESILVNFLIDNGYVYRQGKKLRPYAEYTESGKGYFTLKDVCNYNSDWCGQQMYITPKGKEAFRLLLEKEGVIECQTQ